MHNKLTLDLGLGLGGSGILWDLNDNFTTDVAAGDVNGTAPEPGPGGNRTVIGTAGLLSITSGKLRIAGSTFGDPVLYFADSHSRVKGKMFFFKYKVTAGDDATYITWDRTFDEVPRVYVYGGYWMIASDYFIYSGTANNYETGAIILRDTGIFILINLSGIWYLLHRDAVSDNATYEPGIFGTGCTELNCDFLRIPQILWTPRPVAADAFGGTWPTTDGGGLTGVEAGGSGKTWVADLGNWGIVGGKAVCGVLSGGQGIATIDYGKTDVWLEAKATRAAGNVGLILNYVDASNHVRAYHDGTNAKLDLLTTAGGAVNKLTAEVAYAAGGRIIVRAIGTDYRFWYNTTHIGSTTISDATVRAATKHGLYTTNTGNSLDDVAGFASGSGGEYGFLNAFIN